MVCHGLKLLLIHLKSKGCIIMEDTKTANMGNLFHIWWEMVVTHKKPLQWHAAGAFEGVEWRFMAFPR
jgi:hypothetical protein